MSTTTPKAPRALINSALNLRHFLRRQQVLQLYRSFLRELHGIDRTVALELKKQIRDGFSSNQHVKNANDIKNLINEGNRQLQFVRTYVGTARRTNPSTTALGTTNPLLTMPLGKGIGITKETREQQIKNSVINPLEDKNTNYLGSDTGNVKNTSWVGTGEPDDIRGRIGEGWPWKR